MRNDLILAIIIAIGAPCLGFVIDSIVWLLIKIIRKKLNIKVLNWFLNRITILGTVHHELSHALFAVITGAKVTKIQLLFPSGPVLGKVTIVTRGNIVTKSLQLAMSAVAPVLTGTCSILGLVYIAITRYNNGILLGIIIFFIVSIFLHMTMSIQDIKCYIKGAPICTLIIFCILQLIH